MPRVSPGGRLPHERTAALALAVALVLLRSVAFFFDANFDSDQAIIGLMAKHIAEGRSYPLFTYGQDYNLAIEAWLAAPLFWLAGPSVVMLKLPLLAINVAVVVLLIVLLEKDLGLRPALGFVAASFFVLAPPGTSTYFLEASGVNIEPFLVVLLLWITWPRPLVFGVVLAVGFLHREFAAYGLGALLLMGAQDGSLFTRASWRRGLVALASFGAVWQVVQLLKPYTGVMGPGTSIAEHGANAPFGALSTGQTLNMANLLSFFCWEPARAVANFATLVRDHLGVLLGAVPMSLVSANIDSGLSQGAPGLWMALGAALCVAAGRTAWHAVTSRSAPWRGELRFPTYLFLVGLQAGVVYAAARCDGLSIQTMRYSLLAVFGAIGVTAAFLRVERSRWVTRPVLGVVGVWALVATLGHVRLVDEYVRDPPVNARRVLADHLVSEGIGFGVADFWDAYSTVFFADERVILASSTAYFIEEYQWLAAANERDAVLIGDTPCPDGTHVVRDLYVCPPERPD